MNDHQAVCETVYRYGYALDTRNWEMYRSVFDDEVDFDFSSYHGRPAVRMRADDLVASAAELFAGFVATQHTMTNPLVTIDGDTATCHMYIQAAHTVDRAPDAPWFVMGGHYEDRLARRENGWVLTAVTMKLRWTQGDRAIMRTAIQNGRNANGSR